MSTKLEPSGFINGKWIRGTSNRLKSHSLHPSLRSQVSFNSINPATGAINWHGYSVGDSEVDAAVLAASKAFRHWSRFTLDERIIRLKSYQKAIEVQSEEFARTISLETGKPFWESRSEVKAMIAKVDNAIAAQSQRCVEKLSDSDPLEQSVNQLRFRPLGVIAVLGPFNLPGHLPASHFIPALLAGNTIVFKGSEQTPLVSQRLMEIWQTQDLPGGTINLLQGGASVAQTLAEHPGIDGLCFTGGLKAGQWLQRCFANKPGKMLALELGGNNPLIVWDCHTLKACITHIILSAFITTGQRCVCARRLIIPKGSEGNTIIEALETAIQNIRIGAFDSDPEVFMGPLISLRAKESFMKAQKYLSSLGAKSLSSTPLTNSLTTSSERKQNARDFRSSAFVSPALWDITKIFDTKTKKLDEEYFGPLLQLIRVSHFPKALEAANSTRFGLSAGLLTDNDTLHKPFLSEIKSGIANINQPMTGASGTLPFGGWGLSGNHRPSGFYAADYCNQAMASVYRKALMKPDSIPPGIGI